MIFVERFISGYKELKSIFEILQDSEDYVTIFTPRRNVLGEPYPEVGFSTRNLGLDELS